MGGSVRRPIIKNRSTAPAVLLLRVKLGKIDSLGKDLLVFSLLLLEKVAPNAAYKEGELDIFE